MNIFENVVKRSGLEQPTAEVIIEHKKNESVFNAISLLIKNELGPDIDVAELTDTLQKRKTLLASGASADLIAREGGSGLFKNTAKLKKT